MRGWEGIKKEIDREREGDEEIERKSGRVKGEVTYDTSGPLQAMFILEHHETMHLVYVRLQG